MPHTIAQNLARLQAARTAIANAVDSIEGLVQDWCNAWDIDSSTGNILSSLLKYRNTRRKAATKSSVDLVITSTSPSMPFPSGLIFTDSLNQRWTVPISLSLAWV